MPRHKPGGDAPPSDDIGWRFGTQIQDSRHHILCNFCGHIIKGGITRFKQHLAHMTGQVHGCPSVSREVREEMMRHLKDKKATKSDAQKRKAELEAQLRGGEGDEEEQREYVDVDEDDSDEENAQFNMARRASMQSQHEWEERQTFRRATGRSGATQYETGGSSSAAGAGGSGSQHQPRGGIRRAKLAIKQHCRYYADYWKIIDRRWSFQLHHDLHAAGYYLNPQFQYGITSSRETEREVLQGMKNVISKLEPDIDNQVRAINQLLLFRDKVETFGTPIAQRAWSQTNPAEWWILHGTCAPELQEIAVKVLSQTTTASNCERNWSTLSLIHTKSRNRLKYQKIQKLVFINYNMRLKLRTMKRRSQEEIDNSFNPITLDYIFDEDDPLDPWLEEREAPVLDGQDNLDWLDLDDDGGGDGGEQTLQRGSSSQQHQPRRTSHSSSSSPARSRSSGSGGLTPPSDDDGDGDGGHGTSGGNGDGVGIGGHDARGDEHDAIGSFGLHDVRPDYDIGELAPNLPQRPPMDMAHNFGEFGLYDHSYGYTYPYSEPPQQPYPSYGYGYDPYGYRRDSGYTMPGGYVSQPTFSYSPPVHQENERRRDTDLATFTYVFPTGWDDPSEASSSNNRRQSESGSITPPPPQPPRSSLWWW